MKIKRIISALLLLAAMLSLVSCGTDSSQVPVRPVGTGITDSNGSTVTLSKTSRVVCGYASFAECWLLSGGSLVGVTSDAVDDLGIDPEGLEIIGTVKSLDLEKLVALSPDYVILSADLTAHNELKESLDAMGIASGYFREDSFEDYKAMMAQFCAVNERPDLYGKNVLDVEAGIEAVLEKIPATESRKALLIRAYSTGMKAKSDDNLAGQILKQFGLTNIADIHPSLLEDMSMEQIILDDPDFVFALTMGNEQGALNYLYSHVENDPVWNGLSAVKEDRYVVLPQELFHYKPNDRWDDSYEYLAKIIYPEIFE